MPSVRDRRRRHPRRSMRESGSGLEGAFDAAGMRERIRRAQRYPWIDAPPRRSRFLFLHRPGRPGCLDLRSPFCIREISPRDPAFRLHHRPLRCAFRPERVRSWRAERCGDLLGALRKDVGRRLRATLFATIVIGSLGLFHVGLILLGGLGREIARNSLCGGPARWGPHGFLVSLPRLRRERAELA